METMKKMGIMILCIVMAVFMVSPVMAATPLCTANANGGYLGSGGDGGCNDVNGNGVLNYGDYDYNNVLTTDNSIDNSVTNSNNDNSFDFDSHNVDDSYNTDVDFASHNTDNSVDNSVEDIGNYNIIVTDNDKQVTIGATDVDQNQVQLQFQFQNQDQDQSQSQTQANVQTVIVPPMPKGSDGGLLISNSNKALIVSQLGVGDSAQVSRLVYPGEVLTYKVENGDIVSLRAASDVGLYTVGYFHQDELRIGSFDATPGYDPVFHKLTFGLVVPVDKINFWTTKATLVATEDAKWVVVDNRAPRNGYTHIELTIVSGEPVEHVSDDIEPVVLKPDVYPVDSYGRAITS